MTDTRRPNLQLAAGDLPTGEEFAAETVSTTCSLWARAVSYANQAWARHSSPAAAVQDICDHVDSYLTGLMLQARIAAILAAKTSERNPEAILAQARQITQLLHKSWTVGAATRSKVSTWEDAETWIRERFRAVGVATAQAIQELEAG